MISQSEDFFLALRQARLATHKGDIATAERWMKMAERHLVLARRYRDLRDAESPRGHIKPRRRW